MGRWPQEPCQSANRLKIAPPHITAPPHGQAPDQPAEYDLPETNRVACELDTDIPGANAGAAIRFRARLARPHVRLGILVLVLASLCG